MRLNDKPLAKCRAFELAIIVRNLPEDGIRGSRSRRAAARDELIRRIARGDIKAVQAMNELTAEASA